MYLEKKILNKIQKTQENKVTNDIIIPLLKEMGYKKVEFYGGQSEQGKDIIIWNEDEFGDVVLRVAQVKHFKFTNKASGSTSFQTIVNQLSRCISQKIIHTNQKTYLPLEILLISTNEIDTKTLQTKFDDEPSLLNTKIKIIDGLKLSELIQKHLPDFVNEIIGIKHELSIKMKPKFTNSILLKALRRNSSKEIKLIYTDIDFSLGKLSTKILFNSDFRPKKQDIDIKINDWIKFENICTNLEKEFSINFLEDNLTNIKEKITPFIEKVKKKEEKIIAVKEEILINSTLLIQLKKDDKEQDSLLESLLKDREIQIVKRQDCNNSYEINSIDVLILSLNKQIEQEKRKSLKLKNKIEDINNIIFRHRNVIDKLELECEKISYKININGEKIVDQLISKRIWIEENTRIINSKKGISQENLKKFIINCHSIINASSDFFKNDNEKIFECIGLDCEKNRKNFESTRIKLSIEDVFNTGINITVLGEAGAGKSTSLEMYALNLENTDKLVLLFPLGYLVQEIQQFDVENLDFEILLVTFLNKMGLKINQTELINLTKTSDCVFLLDGLDEAIKTLPSLPKLIKDFAVKNSKPQIILTSRMYGEYIDEIPFFTVTLLPFTKEQRDHFIEKWFEDNQEKDKFIEIIKQHLIINDELSEIVKNPLLTTTLCVLAENKLNLPRTEIKLYDERLHLLTGYYDNVKHIDTRINSTPKLLELIAQKIAFYLHSNNKREDTLENISKTVTTNLRNHYSVEEIESALKELIHPCELLIPMTSSGKYGLGHLRYQEHLTARELLNNRNINLISFLKQDWWFGSIFLFTRMQENIEWFIKEIGETGKFKSQIIDIILKSRHKIERDKLISLLENYKFLHNLEDNSN